MYLISLVQNPDNNKKVMPKIKNSCLAAAIIFFIPLLINEVDDRDKTNILDQTYENGNSINNNSNNSENTSSNTRANVSASAGEFLNSLEKMTNYVKNDKKNTWYYLWDGSSKTFNDAISRNNKHLTCICLPNWGLRDIGVLTPAQ